VKLRHYTNLEGQIPVKGAKKQTELMKFIYKLSKKRCERR
jgi:hypothetical protein